MNADEFSRISGAPVGTEDEVLDAAEAIRRLGVPSVVVTRGGSGAVAAESSASV